MATGFTLSEKVNERIGRKKFKIFQATHDGSATDITAASCGFNYITWATAVTTVALSSAADFDYLTTAYGTTIVMGALSDGATLDLILIGY
jgi:hypothetical protein